MRNSICFFCISLLFISCGGGGSDGPTPTPEPANTAPTVPTLVAPTNALLCINNVVNFEWGTSTDAENNPITYQIQIATDNQFVQIVSTADVSSRTQTFTLDKGKAYYWRVKAIDSKNASSAYSGTYSFYTEGIGVTNHLPFLPEIIQPETNTTITGTIATLKWFAFDADVADILTYDVYLGTVNPPTVKVAENSTSSIFEATSLQAATQYYWRIVVKDNKGGETRGQVWNFRTN
ncbi:hypothetical protein [Flavobacterium sp.]|uniref:glycoside hydrolase family 78 protein n=1 Tax=Flavobacterium sp. TaxID=239 RepID=UPI0035B09CF7